jgi:uncharacterized protein with FMN-binding domain
MAQKMTRRLVALSASAIAAIYAAGFSLTRSADTVLAQSSAVTNSAAVTVTAQPAATATSVPVVGASSASTTTTTPTTKSAYKDGTYTGSGTSRRGGVNVSVTVQGGRITNVQITSVTTEYPVARIASLPAAVIKQQSASVNVVSGATYSSQAFSQAVQNALAQAKAA